MEVYYVHRSTKTVVNLSELRCMNNNDRLIVEKTLYDDTLNIDYNYINDYNKTEIMSLYDWDIVPIGENLTEKEVENYKINRKYVDACKKYNYIGYDVEYSKERERSLY